MQYVFHIKNGTKTLDSVTIHSANRTAAWMRLETTLDECGYKQLSRTKNGMNAETSTGEQATVRLFSVNGTPA